METIAPLTATATTISSLSPQNHARSSGFGFVTNTVWPTVEVVWSKILFHLNADNPSVLSKVLRVIFTLFSYVMLYTKVSGKIAWTIAYLLDHHYYLLMVTCSVALLAVSALLLTSYEYMWRWQDVCLSLTSNTTARSNVLIVDDDEEDSLIAWAKTVGRKVFILLMWSVFCAMNTKLDFWIWTQYMVAHPHYNMEVQLVNCLEAAPLLLGSACAMYYLYPPFFTWHRTSSFHSSSDATQPFSSGGYDYAALQSLL